MRILVKTICKGCGKEFDPRSGAGKPRTYCSEQCRIARNNRKRMEKQAKKLGMSYYAWKWHNDAAFKEKKREYNRKYNRSLTERRRDREKEKE